MRSRLALALTALIVLAVALVSGAHRSSPTSSSAPAVGTAPATVVKPVSVGAPQGAGDASNAHGGVAVAAASGRPRRHRRRVPPGSLPQTHALPSATDARFRELMLRLWHGIVHDSLPLALPAFFPQAAYVQVKAIGSAASDWSERLAHDYRLDIAAAHSLLGRRPLEDRLIRVSVPSADGHWVPPGVCYNRVGYYEVPNSRIVYRQGGEVHSIGIASLISWRGVWYVVHLGAIIRSGGSGVVDEPAAGPGVSRPSSTC